MIKMEPGNVLFVRALKSPEALYRYQNGQGFLSNTAELSDDVMSGKVDSCECRDADGGELSQWLLTGNDNAVFWLFYSPRLHVLAAMEKAAKSGLLFA